MKIAYQNAKHERKKFLNELVQKNKDTSTEAAGSNGYNLQERAEDINGHISDEFFTENESSVSSPIHNAISTLNGLNEVLEEKKEIVYAEFTTLLIKKFSNELSKSPVQKFNELLLRINTTDIPDTSDFIKKLTKIFSRTVLLEYTKHQDLIKAQELAYVKALHRASQYLDSGKMIKNADVFQNPQIVAEYIRNIIAILVSRFSPEAQQRAFPNIKNKILQLNQVEIANKKSPGGAAIGTAITLIKNILNGRDPHFVSSVINVLARIL